jgi:hypothetical protein
MATVPLPELLDAPEPAANAYYIHVEQWHRVRDATHYDVTVRPLLLPEHIGYAGADPYMEQLHATPIAWNSVDRLITGPDGNMIRLPMDSPLRAVRISEAVRVPLPALFEGPAPDPARKLAELEPAQGEHRMVEQSSVGFFVMNRPAVSIMPERGVYDLGDGRWMIGRLKNEDPLGACLAMVKTMGWPAERVREHLAQTCPDEDCPSGPPSIQAEECVKLLGPRALCLPLQGMQHTDAMAMLATSLNEHGVGILFTHGHVRVIDTVRDIGDGQYAVTLRDPDTCAARNIRDHQEFWLDESASPKVTSMPPDAIHGPDDLLVVPPPLQPWLDELTLPDLLV